MSRQNPMALTIWHTTLVVFNGSPFFVFVFVFQRSNIIYDACPKVFLIYIILHTYMYQCIVEYPLWVQTIGHHIHPYISSNRAYNETNRKNMFARLYVCLFWLARFSIACQSSNKYYWRMKPCRDSYQWHTNTTLKEHIHQEHKFNVVPTHKCLPNRSVTTYT